MRGYLQATIKECRKALGLSQSQYWLTRTGDCTQSEDIYGRMGETSGVRRDIHQIFTIDAQDEIASVT